MFYGKLLAIQVSEKAVFLQHFCDISGR